MRHRSRLVVALAGLIAAVMTGGAAAPASTSVSIDVTGLRSARGLVRACLTSHAEGFPNCHEGPGTYNLTAPAAAAVRLEFGAVEPGRYAIALLHDENSNGKVDRALLLMPKEGFGFSRDAPVRMGPPTFSSAAFVVGDQPVHQAIRMRYLL